MAAFIVISADNRLHYLVDGIEKCRPLNPDVSMGISTGKITKSDTGYTYEYTIHGEGAKDDGAKSFSHPLSNQLAAFRQAYNIPRDELIKIFLLENPLTGDDLDESKLWIKGFDEVFCAGQGHDANFCLYRIIFTYNHDRPTDVVSQIDRDTLKRLLNEHKEIISCESSERSFDRYIFYIDNQKNDQAALCLNKEEHDLKMPRFLTDFMMLASSSNDSYNINFAITPTTGNTRCFSVGFAESMYYYPDAERYYIHADKRDLYLRFLNGDDDAHDGVDEEAMIVEKHPFGLRARGQRLAKYYEDIPFSEDIEQYPESADGEINGCIVGLQKLLTKEREKEIEDFNNSPEIVSLQKNIIDLEEQINSAKPNEGETPEEFAKRAKELRQEKDKRTNELNDLIQSFEPECPPYIDRGKIYTRLCVTDKDEEQSELAQYSDEYNKLVDFAKSKKFLNFLEDISQVPSSDDTSSAEPQSSTPSGKEGNRGCLFFLFPRRHNKDGSAEVPSQMDVPVSSESVLQSYVDKIKCIKERLDLKSAYAKFKEDVKTVESTFIAEKKECDDFKLTEHSNHYCPLIDLDKLREEQSVASSKRLDKSIQDWKGQAEPTKSSLVTLVEKSTVEYAKKHFSFVDWEHPFPFVKDISGEDCMARICNELQKRAAPFVSYNLTSEFKENTVIKRLYSDRPNFEDEIKQIRSKLQSGNEIDAAKSVHIASKICMMQFLPLDQAILDHLVDLQEYGGNKCILE